MDARAREERPEKQAHLGMVTVCAIGATLLYSLDQTIANIALPYMQGSFSASYDEITWVITSYITAAAIVTAPIGWIASRFGRKRLFVASIVGFTIASMLCGAAQSIEQMVLFRLLQGVFAAPLVPLAQATLFDIYPHERRGFAMAIWGMGVMIGPIMGPTLGGWLTETYNWRWVFYINLPFGALAATGLLVFMRETEASRSRFDWTGFAALAIGIGSLQMMLDRGQLLDWFTSREIIIEAVIAALGIYIFLVHMVYAPRALIRLELFRDLNFSMGLLMMFAVGTILVSSLTLMTPWLEVLSNYPIAAAGLVMAPRGFGNLCTILIAGRLSARTDPRYLVAVGLALMCYAFWRMSGWTPDVSQKEIITTIVIQGGGLGLVFTPLQVLSFATLPAAFRTEGASLFALFRNIGAAIGVSVTSALLTHHSQALHEIIGGAVNPFNRALQMLAQVQPLVDPATRQGIAMLDRLVARQAEIIAYLNDFKLMAFVSLAPLLLLPLMRNPHRPTQALSRAPTSRADAPKAAGGMSGG